MADEARRMLAGQPDSDAAWHAQRAMEAAQAARMTAKSALAGAASDEDITRVVQRLERALTALAHVRGGPVAVEGTSLQHLRTLQASASRASTFESVGDPETVSDAPTMHDGLSTDLQENPDDEITHIAVRGSGQPLDG